MKKKVLHLNDEVYVQLTEHGKIIYHSNRLSVYKDKSTKIEIKEDFPGGFFKFQLWHLMAIFGGRIYTGISDNDRPFVGNQIHLSIPK